MHHSVNNSHGAAVYTALTGHDRGEAGGLASATGIKSTPTVRINGEDYEYSTPDALVAKIKEIVGDVPGLEAAPPAPAPAPAPAS